ncbi:acyl-CoA dehydrogenase family protein [Caulobacter sp. NIBR1757]|uniref:acyl-CoA dehydrogenase family protein n=1 Tax=Caulobacter sp. NIBR1757 TaxID=3016000 RepID=UPI0022F0AC2F|nr:acyl-CoA dehydrogenase family protein [Caulobacter sp. NIBR1757]WGM38080.1 Flavin-dependent monooxygenase, oxygenase subunit HsaA [Caulobacter sp. NIBR1757]
MDPIALAEGLRDQVRPRADEIEQARRFPPDLAQALSGSGLLRMLVPADLGGLQSDPFTVARAIETLAEGDASSGWCLMIAATTAMMSARLSPEHAKEVFGDPNTLAAGVFAPMGRAIDAGDHWRVSGRWKWGSGSQNAQWVAGGAVLMGEGGPQLDEGGEPLHRMMLFPADQVEFIDTWRTSGLCGTGSLDFAVKDVLVPKGRSVALHSDPPLAGAAVFRFPAFCMLAMGIAAVAIGNARGALADFAAIAQSSTSQGSRRTLAERNVVQSEFAQVSGLVEAARARYFETIATLWRAVQTGGPIPITDRANLRLACAHAAQACAEATRRVYDLGGGAAVFLDSPLQRRFRDAHVMTHHIMVAPSVFELAGRVLLGLPTRDALL